MSPDPDYLAALDPSTDAVAMSLARLRQLAAHETGHTLGFDHNFAASTYGRASVMDYPAPWVEIKDGKLDLSNAYAVGIGDFDKFAVKYAYAQLNLDDWATKGSWARIGVQQTPYTDYTEGIYRYRFQGTIFAERTTGLPSSDAGLSGHYNFAGNYGDIHAGFYNGEGYAKAEANNEKAFMVRGSVRPFPLGGVLLKGLRLTAFIDEDHYVEDAKRERTIGQITYEHPLVNAGFDLLRAKDRTSATKPQISAKGWSLWVTPKLGTKGWEALIRHDDYLPNDAIHSQKQKRDIDGIAYWVQNLTGKSAAILFDRDSLKRTGLTPAAPNTTNYEVKMLISF
jgi:hypothetical protein